MIDDLIKQLLVKERMEEYLDKRGLSFEKVSAYSNRGKTTLQKVRRLLFHICNYRHPYVFSREGYAEYDWIFLEPFKKMLGKIADKLEIEMRKALPKLKANDKQQIQNILNDPLAANRETIDFTEDLKEDGKLCESAITVHNLSEEVIVEYTEPIANEFEKRIELSAKENKGNRKNGKMSKYDSLEFYLSQINNYAWTCENTQEIIEYYKWVILESRRHEGYYKYIQQPLSIEETKRFEVLRDLLQSDIGLLEMGFPYGRSITSKRPIFDSHGYGQPLSMNVLLMKIPVGTRKMYRFIKAESKKPTPIIIKLTRGRYCIRNNCESKIREALNY
jgi:hypothetical protein